MPQNPQTVARQMLDRPAIGSMTLEVWLESELPKALEFLQNKYQMDSRPIRQRIAKEYDLPGLKDELGTARFAAALHETIEAADALCKSHPADIKLRKHIEDLNCNFKKFCEVGDMKTLMEHDVLPTLRAIASGEKKTLDPNEMTNIYNICGALSMRLQSDVPLTLQPDKAQQLYTSFAGDMKQLISYAHHTTGQLRTQAALQGSHVESLQYKNRLADYWRNR